MPFSWLDSVIHSRGPWFFRSFSLGLGPPRSEVLWDSLQRQRFWAFYDVRAWLSCFSTSSHSLSVLSSSDSVSLYRGPWSFLELSTTSALSGFLRRPRFGLLVLRWSDSVLLTEVRGLPGLPSLGLSVLRGPRSEVPGRFSTTSALSRSLRRPRFGFSLFPVRTPPILIGVLGLSVSYCADSVLRGPRSAVSSSVLQIGWLRIFSIEIVSCWFPFYLLTYIRRHELIHTLATSRGHDPPEL